MHYKNGREAKVGDRVIGKTYNVEKPVSGTLLSITPGTDSCSAMVGYLNVRQLDAPEFNGGYHPRVCFVAGTEQHGASGRRVVTTFETDYTHCGNLLHVEDAAELLESQKGGEG